MNNRHLQMPMTSNPQTTIEIPSRTNSKRAIPWLLEPVFTKKSTGSTQLSSLDGMALHYVFALPVTDRCHFQQRWRGYGLSCSLSALGPARSQLSNYSAGTAHCQRSALQR